MLKTNFQGIVNTPAPPTVNKGPIHTGDEKILYVDDERPLPMRASFRLSM